MACGPDPYEQQLLSVFESCCERGEALDGKGLARLCEQLQLEEQAPQLLERLLGRELGDTGGSRITFPQFRDALLSLLAGGNHHRDEIDASPEREVRPKFVFGKKKYGRRSRPENSESDQDVSGSDSDSRSPVPREPLTPKALVFETEISPRKRKTSPEPSPRSSKVDLVENSNGPSVSVRPRGLSEEEELVRGTWERLGAAHEGYLGRTEMRHVCEALGLTSMAEELVQQIFQRLGVEPDGRVSFEQFLHLFRSGLQPTATSAALEETTQLAEEQRSLTFHADESSKERLFISLDTYSSGLVSPEQLLALWEAGGVEGAARLLHDLGLGAPARRPISLAELAAALEDEARVLAEEARGVGAEGEGGSTPPPVHPLATVLHASLIIQQAETKCLKSALEQVLGERDKLRQDVAEANERSALLAQEVDDRHARLEQAAQQQARLQEQRHGEEVRALQAQLSLDREQLAALTTGLELRLGQMQAEETRLRSNLTALTRKCESLDKENCSLRERVAESEEARVQQQWKVDSIPQLELRLSELEGELADTQSRTVQPLQQRLEGLLAENTGLRDANDELTLKLEELGSRLAANKPQASSSEEAEVSCSSGRGKRRGPPGGATSEDSTDEDSPRMGKLRRRTPRATSATTTQAECVCVTSQQLRTRVSELERQLAVCQEQLQSQDRQGQERDQEIRTPALLIHKTRASSTGVSQLNEVFQLMRLQILREVLDEQPAEAQGAQLQALHSRCHQLSHRNKTMQMEFELQLRRARREREDEVQNLRSSIHDLHKQLGESTASEEPISGEELDQVKLEIERLLSARREISELRDTVAQLSAKCGGTTAESVEQPSAPTAELRARVAELEQSLCQMGEEYERCEDYWQGKLEEERRLYETEQAATEERFSELEAKIHEYEMLLCQEQTSSSTGRLSPIEESFALEAQVTDLEEECTSLRERLDSLTEQHAGCAELHAKLAALQAQHALCRSPPHSLLDSAVQTEPKHRAPSLLSSFSSLSSRDKCTQIGASLDDVSLRYQYYLVNPVRPSPPSGQQAWGVTCDPAAVPSAPRGGGEQSCRVQLSVLQTLTARLQQQEQRSRRLEALVTQARSLEERLAQQHRIEISSLQMALRAAQATRQQHLLTIDEQAQRLISADLLVKDLFTENAVLMASNERLERRLYNLQAPGSA